MHIYAFGSLVRGEFDKESDVDLIAICQASEFKNFDPQQFSIYTNNRIKALWEEGNPFSWHLHEESRLIYSSDTTDYFSELGKPEKYNNLTSDCNKFHNLFEVASAAFSSEKINRVFECSNMFLAVRNFATCFALGALDIKEFSRNSALKLGEYSLKINDDVYLILVRCRILCTRGKGMDITEVEFEKVFKQIPTIKAWMYTLLQKI